MQGDDVPDFDLPDPDRIYRSCVETCRRLGVELVPRNRAQESIAEGMDAIAAGVSAPPTKHRRGDRALSARCRQEWTVRQHDGSSRIRVAQGDPTLISSNATIPLCHGSKSKAPMPRSEKEKMLAGEPYRPSAPEIRADQAATKAWLDRYNASLGLPTDERRALLAERLGEVGKGAVVRPPFYCDYGFNIRLGPDVFVNFNCVILDVVEVTIGEGTQIGPAVQIYTADHPRDTAQRRKGLEFGRPIRIGRHVWVGGGAIILPGVTIGDDSVVGAGSVVTRDVPARTTVVGNPARVVKG